MSYFALITLECLHCFASDLSYRDRVQQQSEGEKISKERLKISLFMRGTKCK